MVQHWQRKTIFAMVETVPGTYVTDASLFVAANVLIQPQDITFETKPDIIERNPDGVSLQPIQHVIGKIPASVKFSHRVFGSGTAGTAPSYKPFLLACGTTDTNVAVTSDTFAEDPNAQTTLSIGWEILSEDGTIAYRYALSGVKGNAVFKAGKIADIMLLSYAFEGALAMSTDGTTIYPTAATPVTASTITYPDEVANGIRFGQFVTPTGALAFQCDTFELDFGQKVEMLTDISNFNALGYALISDSAPMLKVGFRVVPRATSDELQKFAKGTAFASSLTLGSTAGKRIVFTTSADAQYKGLTFKAIGAAAGMEAQIALHRTATGTASNAFTVAFT